MDPKDFFTLCRRHVLLGAVTLLSVLVGPSSVAAAENQPPQLVVFTPAAEMVAPEDSPLVLKVGLADAESPAESLQLEVAGLTPSVLEAGGVTVVGTGNSREVWLRPKANAFGQAELTLTVRDELGATFSKSVTVSWTPVADRPQIAPIPDQVTSEGAPPLWVPVHVSSPDGVTNVVLSASVSRTGFFQTPAWQGQGTNRWLQLRPAASEVGSVVVTVQTRVGESALTAEATFQVTVLPREFVATNTIGIGGLKATIFDANRDGWPDLYSWTGDAPGRITTNTRGRLSGQFSLGTRVSQIAFGDSDGDGDVDAFVCDGRIGSFLAENAFRSSQSQLWFSNNWWLGAITNETGHAHWADFDGDGDLDLVTGGGVRRAQSVPVVPARIHRNDGWRTFTTLTNVLPRSRDALVVGDFDGDGRPDLLLGSADGFTNQAVVWRNEGELRFAPTHLRFPAPFMVSAGTVDIDGDGRLDVWAVHSSSNTVTANRTMVLWRQTTVGFAEAYRIPAAAMLQAAAPAWGDFDGDGWPDFVAPRSRPASVGETPATLITNCFALYRNDGRGGFAPGGYLFGYLAEFQPAVADFNRDGSLDLFTPETGGRVMVNQLRAANLPPSPPSGLFALRDGTNVIFTWLPATDLNQTAPLTYNLRVGTRPGTNDVVPSMSLADGTRMVMEPGNAGFALSRRLSLSLRDTDTIYWSVQAVDNSFSGSVWAPEQSLAVPGSPNEPPVIRGLEDVVMDEDGRVTLAVTVTDDHSPPAAVKTEVFTSNRTLFPSFAAGPARATHDTATTNRPITLAPAPNAFGEATITMIATDGRGASSTNRARVSVRPVNDAPRIAVMGRPVGLIGQPLGPVSFEVWDVETSAGELVVTARSLDQRLVRDGQITVLNEGGRGRLQLIPEPGQAGVVTIELTVSDGEATNGTTVDRLGVELRSQAFTAVPDVFPGQTVAEFAWGDFSGDGLMDALTVDEETRRLWLWTNQGGLRWTKGAVPAWDNTVRLFDVADFDGDGDLDVVVAGPLGHIRVLHNAGGIFAETQLPVVGFGDPVILRATDFDGDGKKDIVTLNNWGAGVRIRVWRNVGGGFTAIEEPFLSLGASFAELAGCILADQNGDLLPDFDLAYREHVPSGGPSVRSATWLRYGAAGFTGALRPWNTGRRQLVLWDDLVGDGRVEAVVADYESGKVGIFAQTGGDRFTYAGDLQWGIQTAAAGDVDGDGALDLLLQGNGRSTVLLNLGDRWDPHPTQILGDSHSIRQPLADVDGDGDLDFVAWLTSPEHPGQAPVLSILRNDNLTTNRPPTVPTQLSHAVETNGVVTLRWQAATDPDQPRSLTYNLRIGRTPGSGDAWTSDSDASGRRLIPARGGVGSVTEVRLPALPPGRTYHWSVQAVDASFVGSVFADGGSFHLPGPPEFEGPTEIRLAQPAGERDAALRVPVRFTDPEAPSLAPEVMVQLVGSPDPLLDAGNVRWQPTPEGGELLLPLRPFRAGTATLELTATGRESRLGSTWRLNVFVAAESVFSVIRTLESSVDPISPVGIDLNVGVETDGLTAFRILAAPRNGTVTGDTPRLAYRPRAGFTGFDRIEFAAQRPDGTELKGALLIQVGDAKRIRVSRGPGRTLEFDLRGIAFGRMRLERSLDLVRWEAVQTSTLNNLGELHLGVVPDLEDGGAYYRAVEVP